MHPLAQLDRRFVWHPFTQMKDWCRTEPIVIVEGRGAVLVDARGRTYLDANASIWTNLHGHRHPRINAAIRRQLGRVSHSSSLGLANEPASRLAAELVNVANPPRKISGKSVNARTMASLGPGGRLEKVFYSDDGSTAVEVALKLAWEYTRRTRGDSAPRFLSMAGAYHGDTVGAVSLGHIDLFHRAFGKLLFKTDAMMAPYCYRCPFNRARPERADARAYRECHWECVTEVEKMWDRRGRRGPGYAAVVFEPKMQGAAGMIPQPLGWLERIAGLSRSRGALLIADEVMTGFGRTGTGTGTGTGSEAGVEPGVGAPLFASFHEGVVPDFLCVAKGLTGGYLPMAATLTTRAVFEAFLGEYGEFRTFFHGHSYNGNQLGAAAALASLELLRDPAGVRRRQRLERALAEELKGLWDLPAVGDIRQEGLVAGVELVRDWRTRAPFPVVERVGIRVCEAMARRGILTRPIGNVIVLMPPYCMTAAQIRRVVSGLAESLGEVVGGGA
ncbi:MAG: aspartate aminotransferase family protein [Limisphaerales bacterium]